MKPLLLCLFACSAIAQTPIAPPAPEPLPKYLAAGGAYNQFAGANLWASGIMPIPNAAGMLASTTIDIFPVKTVIAGKTAYIFTTSVRMGAHRFIHHGKQNSFLIGGDGGFSWAQASATGSAISGISASITVTYVRQLSKNWGVMIPVRALYMPSLGGWNPIVEIGLVFKP